MGAICCRVEDKSDGLHLYVMTFVVLAPYRRRGIGSQLLESVLEAAEKDVSLKSIYLHVWTSNKLAQTFYGKYGFVNKETIKGYYKRIDPPDCFLLSKELHADDQ